MAPGSPIEAVGRLPITTRSANALEAFLIGRDHAHHYEFAASQAYFDRALDADPTFLLALLHRCGGADEPDTRGYLARADAARERATEAEGRLADAFGAFMLDDDPVRAIGILEPLAAAFPRDPYLAAYIGFRELWQLERLDEAERWFSDALTRDETFVQAHNWLGYCALHRHDLDGADERFRRYLERAPDHPRPYHSMGVLAAERGHRAEAADWFVRALEVEPRFAVARDDLEWARDGSGDAPASPWSRS